MQSKESLLTSHFKSQSQVPHHYGEMQNPDQHPMSHRNEPMDMSGSENIYSPVSGKFKRPTYVTTIEKERKNFSPLSYHNTLEASGTKP